MLFQSSWVRPVLPLSHTTVNWIQQQHFAPGVTSGWSVKTPIRMHFNDAKILQTVKMSVGVWPLRVSSVIIDGQREDAFSSYSCCWVVRHEFLTSPVCSQHFISPSSLEFKVVPWINKCDLALLSAAFNVGKIFCQFCCFCESKGRQALIGFHSLVVWCPANTVCMSAKLLVI